MSLAQPLSLRILLGNFSLHLSPTSQHWQSPAPVNPMGLFLRSLLPISLCPSTPQTGSHPHYLYLTYQNLVVLLCLRYLSFTFPTTATLLPEKHLPSISTSGGIWKSPDSSEEQQPVCPHLPCT